jgi:hypothetical protein
MDPQRQQTLWAIAVENSQVAVRRGREGDYSKAGEENVLGSVKERWNTKMGEASLWGLAALHKKSGQKTYSRVTEDFLAFF